MPFTRESMACGWSPSGLYGDLSLNSFNLSPKIYLALFVYLLLPYSILSIISYNCIYSKSLNVMK